MSDLDVLKRWQAERRQQVEPPAAWRRVAFWYKWGHFAFWFLVGVGIVLAAHITFSLLFRRPPEQPIERLLSPARRVQIERCFEIGDSLRTVLYKAQENTIRQATHPYLFEAERARLALALRQCNEERKR